MNNKLIFLIIVLSILFGMIFFISKNRNAREKARVEEKIHTNRQQFIQDSLQNIQKNIVKAETEKAANEKVKKMNNNGVGRSLTENEDFSTYINTSITNSSSKTNIAVTIIDESGNISSSISSSIANVYNQTGNSGNTGLLRSSFIQKIGFQELLEGNSEIIEKLKLSSHTDYVALGRIRFAMRKESLVDGMIVCTAKLTMTIISASQRSIIKSFSYSENGNGVSETQAQEAAIDKLINRYYNDYSSL